MSEQEPADTDIEFQEPPVIPTETEELEMKIEELEGQVQEHETTIEEQEALINEKDEQIDNLTDALGDCRGWADEIETLVGNIKDKHDEHI